MEPMEILTAEQMQRVDRRAEEEHGIPATTLMDNAGREVAHAILDMAGGGPPSRILILCGKGNNGGDGITAGRHLAAAGVRARVVLLASAAELKGAAEWALSTARSEGLQVEEVADDAGWKSLRRTVPEHDLLVDALLGTGTRGSARGRILEAIQAVNSSGSDVIAVDVPSGLSGSSAEVPGPCVEARVTLALAAMKIPLALPPACHHAGEVRVLDIGIPRAAMAAEKVELQWADAGLVSRLIPRRPRASHKGSYGHVLVLAGSRGKSGAAVLMARACLRSGAGLVTVAAPASAQPLVAAAVPEAMTEALAETPQGTLSGEALDRVLSMAAARDVLAAGPGLGTDPGTSQVVLAALEACDLPVVVDADALNILAASGNVFPALSTRAVLTPHPGEAARLLGRTADRIQEDRPASARDLSRATGCTVLLKGYRSLVATPSGTLWVNPTGNPGMATGGTGDVLAGIVAAWLGQGLAPADAAVLSTHVHGLAGDLAARDKGEIGMTAGDLVEALPLAYARLTPR